MWDTLHLSNVRQSFWGDSADMTNAFSWIVTEILGL
jgi:hypothetical protein